jgi:hypothetical protein
VPSALLISHRFESRHAEYVRKETPWNRVLLEELAVAQLGNMSFVVVEPEGLSS